MLIFYQELLSLSLSLIFFLSFFQNCKMNDNNNNKNNSFLDFKTWEKKSRGEREREKFSGSACDFDSIIFSFLFFHSFLRLLLNNIEIINKLKIKKKKKRRFYRHQTSSQKEKIEQFVFYVYFIRSPSKKNYCFLFTFFLLIWPLYPIVNINEKKIAKKKTTTHKHFKCHTRVKWNI